ncbi:MAG: histidine phosphatase family protein [Alphaproteobacteria bacterium]|nr:histidine phosphatase family protein [Alphaproteobacteria bacterium]
MPRWTFLRHGESVANAEGWLAGHTDAPLTAKGEAQAIAQRDVLKDVPFTRVLVSDLQRARRTLALALPDWSGPVVVSDRLRERTIGDWDGMTADALRALGGFDVLVTWDGRPPNGESHADLARRVIAELDRLDADEDTLVVCHGALMRAVLGVLDDRPKEAIGLLRYPNCALQTRQVERGGWARFL